MRSRNPPGLSTCSQCPAFGSTWYRSLDPAVSDRFTSADSVSAGHRVDRSALTTWTSHADEPSRCGGSKATRSAPSSRLYDAYSAATPSGSNIHVSLELTPSRGCTGAKLVPSQSIRSFGKAPGRERSFPVSSSRLSKVFGNDLMASITRCTPCGSVVADTALGTESSDHHCVGWFGSESSRCNRARCLSAILPPSE